MELKTAEVAKIQLAKMKTFKHSKWDSDASGDEAYRELFKEPRVTLIGGYIVFEYGKPNLDEKGDSIQDEYSKYPTWKQHFLRGLKQIENFTNPPEKSFCQILFHIHITNPPYTLVLEFTDVLAHPDWTYKTGWRFKKRPGLDYMLENLVGLYEIVVFTAEPGMTIFPVIEALDQKNLISYKLVRDSTHFVKGHHVKNLDKLNRDLKKIIVVDWNSNSIKFHPDNHLNIKRWCGNDDDTTLIDLTSFLKTIAHTEIDDVRDVLKFYKQYDDPLLEFRNKQKEFYEKQEQNKSIVEKPIGQQPIKKGNGKKKKKILQLDKTVQDKEQKRRLKKLLKGKHEGIKSKSIRKKLLKQREKQKKVNSVDKERMAKLLKIKDRIKVNHTDSKNESKLKIPLTEEESKFLYYLNKELDKELNKKLKEKINVERSQQIGLSKVFEEDTKSSRQSNDTTAFSLKRRQKLQEKLKNVLTQEQPKPTSSQHQPDREDNSLPFRQRLMEQLKAARFRFLNEQIYTTTSKEAHNIFKRDPEAFMAYHEGYRQQVKKWPLNPLDVIIKSIRKLVGKKHGKLLFGNLPKNCIIADFGCGDAKLAKSVEQRVYSFDLIAVDETVVACDMAKVPLKDESVHVAVFCLSLMGTNLHDYLLEANRVLKVGGLLKIAEVESRFEDVEKFIEGVQKIWIQEDMEGCIS
ncbi:hypothetical protein NQ317_002727 [Molorchus minor]|uniref:Ribosomal RNA-processing protein 8 n=1 Tax=Molorchus minor TaxID=1323400 RepID=A0ABQ9K4F3_9CUCU|nr:hypothetical protein NQ317_002727 [Molorchus minor]